MKKSLFYAILAIIIGVLVALLVAYLGQMLVDKYFPFPIGMDMKDSANLSIFYKSENGFWSLALLIISYLLGVSAGTFAAGKIAHHSGIVKGVIVGLICIVFIYFSINSFWHPTWFKLVALIAPLPVAIVSSSFAVYWAKEDEAAIPDDEGEIHLNDIIHPHE